MCRLGQCPASTLFIISSLSFIGLSLVQHCGRARPDLGLRGLPSAAYGRICTDDACIIWS